MAPVYAVGSGTHWDESRNSSSVRVTPNALRDALRVLNASHNEDWYRWIVNRQNGVHDHHAVRNNGKPADCPVVGCTAVREALGIAPR